MSTTKWRIVSAKRRTVWHPGIVNRIAAESKAAHLNEMHMSVSSNDPEDKWIVEEVPTEPTYRVIEDKSKPGDWRESREVHEGDTLTDFRGDTAKFIRVTRGREYNGTAKVLVEWPDGFRHEYYAQVFDLSVFTEGTEF
jgi:hypothetical protein